MIEHVTVVVEAGDWYEAAQGRARASSRPRVQGSCEWPEFAPPVALSGGPLGAVQAADREIARQTALRARAVAEFAASRPAAADRGQGEPGAMSPERWAGRPEVLRGVSEWAGQELVVALSIGSEAAEALLTRSLNLVHRLPGTLAALEAGALHPGHLWPMLEKVAPIEDDAVRAEVEAELLRWSAGRVTSPAQLAAKARREVARRDARAAARRLEKAIKERGVHLRPEPTDGMAAVTAVLTLPECQVLHRALGAYADAIEDDPDHPRTRGQKMADCLLDLVLRPGETGLPPVQLLLTVVASLSTLAGGDDPGEVDGHVVPAEMVRELLRLLGGWRPEPPALPDADRLTRSLAAVDGVTPSLAAAEISGPSRTTPAPEPTPVSPGRPDRPPLLADADEPPCAWTSGTEQGDGSSWLPTWQQAEQEELERWWDEVERRVLAGELGPEPDAMPDEGTGTCTADIDPLGDPPWRFVGLPDGPPSAGPPPDAQPSSGDTWWATADRAVDQAGMAVRQAEQALSHAVRMVRTASTADAADEAAWQGGPGRFTDADDALAVLRSATDAQRDSLADLLVMTGGGGLAERPRIALTDAASGALLALTGLPGLRQSGTCGAAACRRAPGSCDHDLTGRPGLGPPGPTEGYRPSAALDRWARARDHHCRFPGCRRRVPRGGELDHDRPYPHGPTSAGNLVGYCTSHHRGKHQAPGWQHALAADGTLTVTTPTGLTAVTFPPRY
jgi:hypothetical protein